MSAPYSNQPPPIGLVGPPPSYPPTGQPGYPSTGQPGYPSTGQPGYPQSGQFGGYPPYPQPYGQPPPMQPPGYPPPQQQQPSQVNWMVAPMVPSCPPGLEYLTQVDQLLVQQKVEVLEAVTAMFGFGLETKNKYLIKNSMGQKVYSATEQSNCCTRNCCGPRRCFDMKIKDSQDREVIHFSRPWRCDSCCFPCCLQKLEVTASGSLCGTVEQSWSICWPKFKIRNAAGETVLQIAGPFCTWSICGDVEFQVLSRDGNTKVGRITKQWSGLARELFTDADHFGISFPMDLDVNIKAVLLGACFLIDFMFFEKSGNSENDMPGMLESR